MIHIGIKQIRLLCVYITIILLPFMSYVKFGGITTNMSFSDLLLPLALLLTYIKPSRIVERNLRKYLTHMTVLLMLMAFSFFNIVKWDAFTVSLTGYLTAMLKFIICFLYLLVFAHFISENKEKTKQITDVFILSSVLDACLGYGGILLNLAGIHNSFVYENTYRVCGSFSDPNLFACFIFIGLYLTIFNYQKYRQVRYLVAVFFQIGVILLTASKAALISIAVFLFFWIVGQISASRKRIKKTSLLVVLISIAVLALSIVSTDIFTKAFGRFQTLLTGLDDDFSTGRVNLWRRSFVLIMNSPIFGVGLGMHNVAGQELLELSSNFIFHNTYLNYIVELGIFGLIWIVMGVRFLIKHQIALQKAGHGLPLMGLLAAILFMIFTLDLENFRNLWLFICLLLSFSTERLQKIKK